MQESSIDVVQLARELHMGACHLVHPEGLRRYLNFDWSAFELSQRCA
jgi:hypothetical protein